MAFFLVFAILFVFACLHSKYHFSPVVLRFGSLIGACVLYSVALWEMRDAIINPGFWLFPIGMIASIVYIARIDWRDD